PAHQGIAGEKFRSNTSILQLPAHSQRTPLSVAGINPTTFRLLVSLCIQANLGRGGGWAA
ncbi:MICAL-like protein 2, partial [Dissostichus eleginoides]